MAQTTYKINASERYDGPDFEEYCISEGRYLPAARDRSPCIPCPLYNLCQIGFEEQVRRIALGENPSLTENCAFTDMTLSPENLLEGLTREQTEFVMQKIPNMNGDSK